MTPLPAEAAENVLRSIFADTQLKTNRHMTQAFPLFATPFGASVLMCGMEGCGFKFYDPEDPKSLEPGAIHKLRAKHFKEVFGLGSLFSQSPHGLPENTLAHNPPTSMHINLHSSIARVWSELPRAVDADPDIDVKDYPTPPKLTKDIVWRNDEEALAAFATAVRLEICARNKKGNDYMAGIELDVRAVLPSFSEALRLAGGEGDEVEYVHNWTRNSLADKIGYELALRKGKE